MPPTRRLTFLQLLSHCSAEVTEVQCSALSCAVQWSAHCYFIQCSPAECCESVWLECSDWPLATGHPAPHVAKIICRTIPRSPDNSTLLTVHKCTSTRLEWVALETSAFGQSFCEMYNTALSQQLELQMWPIFWQCSSMLCNAVQ